MKLKGNWKIWTVPSQAVSLWTFSGQYLKQSRICGTFSDIVLEFKEIICHLLTFYFSFCEIIIGAFFIPNPTSSCLKKNPLLFVQNKLRLFDICSLYFFSFEEPKNVFYLLVFCSDEREAKFKEQKFRGSNQFRDHPVTTAISLCVQSAHGSNLSFSKNENKCLLFSFRIRVMLYKFALRNFTIPKTLCHLSWLMSVEKFISMELL